MVQSIVEMVVGVVSGALGLLILASLVSASFTGQDFTYFPLSGVGGWLPALLAYVATLVVIALGALMHGTTKISRQSSRPHGAFSWVGRVALWLATISLGILVYLSGFSIGLFFIPSAALALIACALSLIPNPAYAAWCASQPVGYSRHRIATKGHMGKV